MAEDPPMIIVNHRVMRPRIKTIRDAPREVLIRCLSYLAHKELLRCRRACKQWDELITSSEELRLSLFLSLYGKSQAMGPAPTMSTLMTLFEHQRRWATLDPARVEKDILGDDLKHAHLTLSGADGSMLLLDVEKEHTVGLGKLGSQLAGTDTSLEGPVDLPDGVKLGKCIFNAAKDLLIISTGHLKWDIRRLSDPEQFHARSYNTSFDGEHALPSGQPVTDGGSKMVLVGDWVLVVMTGNAKNFICVFAWDWVTCEIKFRLLLPKISDLTYNVQELMLLGPNHLVLPISETKDDLRMDGLRIYQWEEEKHSSSFMDHSDFPTAQLVRTFALPLSKAGLKSPPLWTLTGHVDNQILRDRRRDSAASQLTTSTSATVGSLSPFADVNPAGILVFCLTIPATRHTEATYFTYVTHVKTLLSSRFNSYFDAGSRDPIPWSVWGAKHCACFPGKYTGQRERWAVHGDRLVVLEPDWNPSPPPAQELLLPPAEEEKKPTTRNRLVKLSLSRKRSAMLLKALPGHGSSSKEKEDSPTSPEKTTNPPFPPPPTFSRATTSASLNQTQTTASEIMPLAWRLIMLDFNQDRVRRHLLPSVWPAEPEIPPPPIESELSTVSETGELTPVQKKRRSRPRPVRVVRGVGQEKSRDEIKELFGPAYEVDDNGKVPVKAELPYLESVYATRLRGAKNPSLQMDGERIVLSYEKADSQEVEVLTF